jgi:hypothetical protein
MRHRVGLRMDRLVDRLRLPALAQDVLLALLILVMQVHPGSGHSRG